MSSRLFEAYRTVGLVCDEVPFAFNKLGKERFLTASVGRSFLVYNVEKLHVTMASTLDDRMEGISCMASFRETTFAATGSKVLEYNRGKVVRVLLDDESFGPVVALLVFGDFLVCAHSAKQQKSSGFLTVFKIKSGERVRAIPLDMATPTHLMHPETYLNKVIVSSASGKLHLVNIRTGKVVYKFEQLAGESAITCVEQSPVTDVVGIGFADGRILVHNLRLDSTLFEFKHTGTAVTTLSFRSDQGGRTYKVPFSMLVSGSSSGEIAVWDLDERRMASIIRDAHEGSVSRALFLPNEPLLVTSGADNCIKVYIFDQEDGQGRLLKLRQGHKYPPTCIQYYGGDTLSTLSSGADAACCQILSAGRDRSLRIFHTAREQLNRELSQGPIVKKKAKSLDVKIEQLKLPPILEFAATEARQRDWCNILSAHAGEGAAFTWSLENRVLGEKVLRPDGDFGNLSLKKFQSDQISLKASKFPAALSVAISACGSFGLVGTASGVVFKYNMQSGLPRGTYPKPSSKHLSKSEKQEMRRKRRKLNAASVHLLPGLQGTLDDTSDNPLAGLDINPEKHEGAVTGVGVDSLNSTLYSAGHDGTIRFWDFMTHTLNSVLAVGSPISKTVFSRDAGLIAAACDDLRVLVIDISTYRAFRTFRGHAAGITAMAFSRDARWLATASSDTSLRVWDLATARCIEWVEFSSPVTGLSFSPTGEFLASTFADSVGITLWANKTYFGTARADAIARKPIFLQSPSAVASEEEAPSAQVEDEDIDIDQEPNMAESEDGGQVRFSGHDLTKWYTLAHLEMIKERNKPKEPPQKPEKAPFFLPTTKAVNPSFVAPSAQENGKNGAEEQDDDMPTGLEQSGSWSDDDASEEENEKNEENGGTKIGLFSRVLKEGGLSRPRSRLFRLLEECHATYQAHILSAQDRENAHALYDPVVEHLKSLSPSAIDFELHSMSLGPEDDDGGYLLRLTLEWLAVELEARQNFDLCQAVLSRILGLHRDSLAERQDLNNLVNSLLKQQREAWNCLKGKVQHVLCLLNFFSHQQ